MATARVQVRPSEQTELRSWFHPDPPDPSAIAALTDQGWAYLVAAFGPVEITVSGPAADLVEWADALAAYAHQAFDVEPGPAEHEALLAKLPDAEPVANLMAYVAPVVDLMAALEASLVAARASKDDQYEKGKRPPDAETVEVCAAPGCEEPTVYLGLCQAHATEETGPQYPSQADLLA